ncbi:MAG: hypothetical protein U0271_39925 [Polyangiaceae bacterium]
MPYLGSTLFVSTIVVFSLVSLLATLLLGLALFRPFVERVARASHSRPKTSLLVGLPITLLLAGVLAACARAGGLGRGVAIVLGASALTVLFIGLTGLALNVGAALSAAREPQHRLVLRGALVLELAMALPLFGWFILTPLFTIWALGASVIALFEVSPAPSHADAPLR